MRIFVTGGTGFVGSAVIRKLLANGHEVRALVRQGTNTRQLDDLNVERIIGDLSNTSSLREGMTGCDWVFHVAALYAYWGYSWDKYYQSNVEGTRRVMEAAQRSGVKRIVYTSSIATLDIPPDGSPGDEGTPVSLADMIGSYKRSSSSPRKYAAINRLMRDFDFVRIPRF